MKMEELIDKVSELYRENGNRSELRKMRPIDANFVVYVAKEGLSEEDASKIRWLISHIPTIKTEPMKHGKWIRDDWRRAHCSVCEKPIPYVEEYDTDEEYGGIYEVEIDETPFCPNCGVRMDLEE